MDTIGGKIRFLRESKKMTQAQLAKAINVASVTVSKWELDVSKPKGESIIRLSETFNVVADTFISHKNKIGFIENKLIYIDFYPDVKAAAGCGCLALDEKNDLIQVPDNFISNQDNTIAITISGDSMEPVFSDQTIVFVDQLQTNVIDGKVYVFVHEGMVRMKILECIPHGLRMKSYNSCYPAEDINLNKDYVKVIGKVVAQMQRYT